MRLFLSIDIEEAICVNVQAMQERLKASDADVRWVAPQDFHLTVKFLGDVGDALLPEIETVCENIAARTPPFRIAVGGASYFPRKGPLKTLWTGLSEGSVPWKALAQAAETDFAALGIASGNDLVPHITLGRVKSEGTKSDGTDGGLRALLAEEARTECGAQRTDRLTLMQSFLHPAGAVHQNVRTWPLQ